MKQELSIKASALKALNRIASTDLTRYVINGVHVELNTKGCTLTATDGRRLITLHRDDQRFDEEISFTIPSVLINALPESMLFNKLPVLVDCDEKQISIRNYDLELRSLPVGGDYPNWRAVVPNEWPKGFNAEALAVNYEYLQDIFEALKELASNTSSAVIAQATELDPICIRVASGFGELLAMLMPVRFNNKDIFAIPDFAKPETSHSDVATT